MKKATFFLKKYSTYIIFLVAVLICIAISPDFFTPTNIVNIGRQYAGLIIVSMGMLFVILTGGIDLSVGSIVALGSVITATCLVAGMSLGVAMMIALLCGILCGIITGVLVSYAKMAPFIASMAMMTMARGVAFVISNGSPIPTPEGSIIWLGTGAVGVIPTLVIIAVAVVVAFWFMQNYTSFGRIVIAIGSNETAVRLAGIRVKLYKTGVYVISGLCCALAGILLCSRTAIGSPVVGEGMELDAIAACVIGGASLSGGEGSAVKAVIGVLILALIGNIMNLLAVPSYPQDIIKGIIIVASVLLQTLTSSNKKEA
ncbi:ABC transporter permease [Christensenella tenuis]|uniref:ABC transporter permease n=1 Tax=Christensenella tenuis TaxID=2763033 RepID=A0ABR7EHH2_9FIRM|nr:ABC transporter permease [Christensenella tenuis]MBC5649211.1 ABC transporter permease [Christensenella tenuis]